MEYKVLIDRELLEKISIALADAKQSGLGIKLYDAIADAPEAVIPVIKDTNCLSCPASHMNSNLDTACFAVVSKGKYKRLQAENYTKVKPDWCPQITKGE